MKRPKRRYFPNIPQGMIAYDADIIYYEHDTRPPVPAKRDLSDTEGWFQEGTNLGMQYVRFNEQRFMELYPKHSDQSIAKHIGCSLCTVKRNRRRLIKIGRIAPRQN